VSIAREGARKRLDQLGVCGTITSSDREKIKAALAQRVPPITPEQEAGVLSRARGKPATGDGSMSA
jgi:hypothetical protein